MDIKINNMCDWERKKAIFLLSVAEDIGYNTTDYGELAVNQNSGYVYIWSEMQGFSLYMPINCELQKSDIVALWTNPDNGEEIDLNLTEDTTLEDLEEWADSLYNKVE